MFTYKNSFVAIFVTLFVNVADYVLVIFSDVHCVKPFFIVGMSSKGVLKMVVDAVQSSLPIVFHMDCTFKCNYNEFPFLVLVITDAQQQFHPLSIGIIFH